MIEDRRWRAKRGLAMQLRRAGALVLKRAGLDDGALTILLSNDEKLHALNIRFRGKDNPTNVLSFPCRLEKYIGDVAIAYGITAREARALNKSFASHATHLAVHGVLHLLGYDHVRERDARTMETLETAILNDLGIANPYARKAA
jgi:probable rRNA maturation factor